MFNDGDSQQLTLSNSIVPVDWPKLELSPRELILQPLSKCPDRLLEPVVAPRTHVKLNLSADALVKTEKALVRRLRKRVGVRGHKRTLRRVCPKTVAGVTQKTVFCTSVDRR